MNWVLIVVVLLLIYYMGKGYRRGLLWSVYSFVSWAAVLIFVSWASPYVTSFLMENTPIYDELQKYSREQIERLVENNQEQWVQQVSSAVPEKEKQNTVLEDINQELAQSGLGLPKDVLAGIVEQNDLTAKGWIEQNKLTAEGFFHADAIYEQISRQIADFTVRGIAFLISLAGGRIAVMLIAKFFGIVSYIPVLGKLNRMLGFFAGGVYGLLLVWLAFYIIAVCSSGETGQAFVAYIYESRFLTYLYENNPIITILMSV